MTDTFLKELQICFRAYNSLIQKENTLPDDEVFNLANYTKAFSSFKNLFQRSEQHHTPNIFELCNVGRDEVKNCRLLAWWLDKNAPHGLGCRFLEKMLISSSKKRRVNFTKDLAASNYSTRTEICPNGDNSDRVDIICESSNILIYIEVKIDSTEHTAQTERYFKRLQHNAGGRQFALFFISPNRPPDNSKARFISWTQLGEIARNLADEATSNFIRQMLVQYGKFVREF